MELKYKSRMLKVFFSCVCFALIFFLYPDNCRANMFINAENNDQLIIGYSDFTHLPNSMATGDFNNDGIDDLAVGVPKEDHPQGAKDTGIVSVFLGSSDLKILPDPAKVRQDEDITFYGGAVDEQAGYLLAAGDLNDDDKDDLVIVAQKKSTYETVKIYVVYGAESLTGDYLSIAADIVIDREAIDITAIAVGDVNHDNIDDLVIADDLTGTVNPGPFHTSRSSGPDGAVYVIFGGDSLPATINLETESDLTITRNGGADLFQAYSLAIGDVNDDDYGDLAIGVPRDDGAGGIPPAEAGQVHVLYGEAWSASSINVEDEEDLVIYGAYPEDHIGGTLIVTTVPANPLAIGDINDDNIGDLIIGAPDSGHGQPSTTGWGKVEVVYGSASLPASINLYNAYDIRLVLRDRDLTFEYTGFAVAAADVNCDSIKDILISTPRAYLGGGSHSEDGILDVVYGGSSLTSVSNIYLETSADLTIAAPSPTNILDDGHMGSNFVVADLDDSGKPDLVIGAPQGYTSSVGWAAFFLDPVCRDNCYVSLDGICNGRYPCFNSISAAFNGSGSGSTINVTNESYSGDILLNHAKSFTIWGGWNSTYTDDSLWIGIEGKLTIQDDSLTLRNMIIY
jgi:hypothetical protein